MFSLVLCLFILGLVFISSPENCKTHELCGSLTISVSKELFVIDKSSTLITYQVGS